MPGFRDSTRCQECGIEMTGFRRCFKFSHYNIFDLTDRHALSNTGRFAINRAQQFEFISYAHHVAEAKVSIDRSITRAFLEKIVAGEKLSRPTIRNQQS